MKKTERNYIILVTLFITCIVASNVAPSRTVLIGKPIFGIQLQSGGAVIAYPITFLCTDIIGEIWGKKKANEAVLCGFIGQVIAFLIFFITGFLPTSNAEADVAFKTLLGTNWIFICASLVSFMFSQTWDVYVFHKLRDWYIGKHGTTKGGRWIWNNGSTLTSQIWDTLIYTIIAFGFGLGWFFTAEGRANILGLIIGQYVIKAGLALLDTPFFYFFTRNADKAGKAE